LQLDEYEDKHDAAEQVKKFILAELNEATTSLSPKGKTPGRK